MITAGAPLRAQNNGGLIEIVIPVELEARAAGIPMDGLVANLMEPFLMCHPAMTGMTLVIEERQPRIVVPLKRGLGRVDAASYVGIGVTMYDQLVREGKFPQPVHIRGRLVWDVRELDLAFERLFGPPGRH